MMRLSCIWAVDSTVDSDGRSPIADQVAERWPHERGSTKFMRSSSNFVYTFLHESNRYYLRFVPVTERERAAIESELDLIEWLAQRGVPAVKAEPSKRGERIETVDTGAGAFNAVVFPAAVGQLRELEDLSGEDAYAWGAALGHLHSNVRDYPQSLLADRHSFTDQLADAADHLQTTEPAVRRELRDVQALIRGLPPTEEIGAIHGDFQLDNLYWSQRVTGIIDFDDCSWHWLAADIALALADVLEEADGSSRRVHDTFVAGYRSQATLNDAMLAQLPLFTRTAKILRYARIVRSLDLSPTETHPAWMRNLYSKLVGAAERFVLGLEAESDH